MPQEREQTDRAVTYKALTRAHMADNREADILRALRRRVKHALRVIRRAYKRTALGGHTAAGGFDEWLADNYHLLMREGEGTLSGLKYAGPQPSEEGEPALYRLFLELIDQVGVPDGDGLNALLETAGQVRPLTVFELAQLPLCLRSALLMTAAHACEDTGDEALRRMSLAVSGLRAAAEIDYADIVERHSIVERLLADDPAGVYPRMDDATKAEYRRQVALLALEEGTSEAAVAARLVEQAGAADDPAACHVGHTLLRRGRRERRARGRAILVTTLLLPAFLAVGLAVWTGSPWALALLYLPAYELLRPVVEYVGMKGLPPARLPRIELDGVIPEEGRTVIAVSTLLPSADRAAQTARHLAHLYNTNGRGAVQICLLADLRQAAFPEMPQDAADIAAMIREVRRLNRRLGSHFLLAVRHREYSPTMQAYTGRERKRGAIEQLVRAIRGGDSTFRALEGDVEALQRAKYLIALDADTGMLLDTAAQMVGVALHPANRPVLDETGKRVVRGFGVLCPRMGVELTSADRTPFSRSMAGLGGVTPYDVTAGDLYMDCFFDGIYAGKGLLDIEAFAAVTQDAFPEEQVLSHDILEGCLLRAGYLSDVEMTDGFPSTMEGWLGRLHRWVRGDWQNMPFLFRGLPLSRLDRFKLLDNLRRSVTPAAALLCLLLAPLFARGTALAVVGLLAPLSGQLLAALLSCIHGGWLTLSGRYYSRVMPRAMSALVQALFNLIMLPAVALTGLGAAGRALWRLRSRRRLLEWVTAADADRRGGWGSALRRLWPTLVIAAAALIWGTGLVRLAGVFFAALIPLAVYSARPGAERRRRLTEEERGRVAGYAAAMWRYYEEFCTGEEHYLPPDNLQESPVWRVAHRTSPTNIGMYLLCILAAFDFGFIDGEGAIERVDRTLATVERLDTWKGNLYNWYDTRSLRPLAPRYVSTVDSGNLACSLTALRQGLLDMREPGAPGLADRVQKLLDALDLRPLYNQKRALFHIGLDPDTGACSPSYYDLLMSESRMTGYYAIATRAVPKKHWGALGRLLARSGGYVGPVSWTGTMFEYFMPRLLLPAVEGSMSYEALRFCLHCQRRRPPRGVPWGISESGFYAFDGSLNYQYKAHGVPKLGLKRGLAADLVIAPYATFLTLTTDPGGALLNLERLERLGMTGRCGFYEAADFTRGRAPRGGYAVVRSYMAHHVGMSLLACANAVFDDIFVRRFMRDGAMARAAELLYEKAPVNGSVYEGVQERTVPDVPGRTHSVVEEYGAINPRAPHMQVLSGGEWMVAVTDAGAGISSSRGLDIHMRSADLLRRPQGIFAFVDTGDGPFSLTRAPAYEDTAGDEDGHRAEFGPGYAAFYARKGAVEAGMRLTVHPRLPCEQRQVALVNRSAHRLKAKLLFYFEPSLARREDVEAHPAFSRLFLAARYDPRAKALFITRRRRAGEAPVCLAVGLLDGAAFEYEASREALLERPLGIASLPKVMERPFSSRGSGLPDGAVALRLTMELPAHAQRTATLVLAAATTETEAATRLIEIRREGTLSAAKAAPSPFGGVEAQLAAQILPDLFYPPRMSREWAAAARENTRGVEGLWALGLSGDYPILLLEVHNAADASRAEPYMRLHRSLRLGGVPTELAIVYREGGAYDAPIYEALRAAARAVRCEGMLGARGGIHAVNLFVHGEAALTLLTAVCVHNGARDLQRAGLPPVLFAPAPVYPVEAPEAEMHRAGLVTAGGIFTAERFTVTASPRLPWCHVLANPTFGTLVSDRALGFTWAVNARENKLTPWFNDTASDNRGEMLLLRAGGRIHDTVWGARPTFGDGYARYEGRAGDLRTTVTVSVPARGMVKQVTLEVCNGGSEEAEWQAAYYTEPVLGVDRRHACHTVARWEDGALLLHNPFATVHGHMLLTAEGGADGCDCDRGTFLAGGWGGGTLSPLPDPCAAVIVRRRLPPGGRETVRFRLCYAAREVAAFALSRLAPLTPGHLETPRLTSPDKALDALCRWLPYQVVRCRIEARTGFYQCGGAWGFRDQLQDSLAALWVDPVYLRRQLMRCAAAQFEEGDVLHWWHRLPGGYLRGVRTRCSDDLVWLPYAACIYADFTGDGDVFDVPVAWLTGDPLSGEEQDRYFAPGRSAYRSPLYDHCVRALDRAATKGAHGLPLIGGGDWNDGFNRLGDDGRGESVWLAMFLVITLEAFAPVCEARDDAARAEHYRLTAAAYREAVTACFDGDRFLRAFTDDGVPLGRAGAPACAIDSLTQSFAVFSGMPADKCAAALDTALRELVDDAHGVVRLFTPPFDQPADEVGYIASYPPGVRENGGQYTHAAAWLAIALFEAGRPDDGCRVLHLLNTVAKYVDGPAFRYGGEPYALAGDVYANPECPGRVGWSQYTGSAGWMFTAVLHHLLGLRPRGNTLIWRPCLPTGWPGFRLEITLRATPLTLVVNGGDGTLLVDGRPAEAIPLDGAPHTATLA